MLTIGNSQRGEGRGQNDPNLVVEMEQGGERERSCRGKQGTSPFHLINYMCLTHIEFNVAPNLIYQKSKEINWL
jgi:hypothetical protein